MIRETYSYSVTNNPLFLKMPVLLLIRAVFCCVAHEALRQVSLRTRIHTDAETGMAVHRYVLERLRHGTLLRHINVR
jgi:hypothetical protein